MATVKVSSELLDKFKSHMDADEFGSPDSITLTPALVLAVALLYMMASDGEIEEAESSQLQSVVGNNDELLSCALSYVQSVSIEAFLEKAPEVLSQKDKLCILVNVFDSLLADGRADQEELDLFHLMRNAFGVNESIFKTHIQVITLKNDKSVLGSFQDIKEGDQQVTPHLALAVAVLYMMSADGAIGPEEIGQLEAVIGEFVGLQKVALTYVRKVKRVEFFKTVSQSLSAKQKLCILTNVCDSMMSDGTVAVAEDKLFVSMVAAFGLQLNDFDKYHEVLEVKNIRPFDTSKFKSHTNRKLAAGAKAEDGEIFEAQGAASELGIEVRRTMHDNIDSVQHDFGSEENILQVSHNATDDLNIQQVTGNGGGEQNVQQVSNDALGVNLQQVNNDALGANLQQVNGEPANSNAAEWIAGAANVVNRQALDAGAEKTERQRLEQDRQSANVQTLDVATAAQNRQALEAGALGNNPALIDANTATDHLETLPPEARVKNLFQDIEVLSRQLDDFESKNKTLLELARRARAQEEANQQALINQQLADNAIALAQAASAQTLGEAKEHEQSNLQGIGAQALTSNRQPLGTPLESAANQAPISKEPITDKVIGSSQSKSSQALGAPKEHLQSNLQDIGIEVLKGNRQLINGTSDARDLALSGAAPIPEMARAVTADALSQSAVQGRSAGNAGEQASTDTIATPMNSISSDAASGSAGSTGPQSARGVHVLLAHSARARHDFKVHVKLMVTFFVLSFWTSNIAAIYPVKQRMVSGSLVRIQIAAPDAPVVESFGGL